VEVEVALMTEEEEARADLELQLGLQSRQLLLLQSPLVPVVPDQLIQVLQQVAIIQCLDQSHHLAEEEEAAEELHNLVVRVGAVTIQQVQPAQSVLLVKVTPEAILRIVVLILVVVVVVPEQPELVDLEQLAEMVVLDYPVTYLELQHFMQVVVVALLLLLLGLDVLVVLAVAAMVKFKVHEHQPMARQTLAVAAGVELGHLAEQVARVLWSFVTQTHMQPQLPLLVAQQSPLQVVTESTSGPQWATDQ